MWSIILKSGKSQKLDKLKQSIKDERPKIKWY